MPKKELSTEERIKLLEQRITKLENPKPKVKRKPSPFNLFMQQNVPKVKEQNPDLSHSEAFSKAASLWKESKKT